MLSKKKKNLRPGEDYSVYKSKAAASICNSILFKKKKNLDLTIPLSGLSSLQMWKTGRPFTGAVMWDGGLAIHPSEEANPAADNDR